jgi:predicted GIY-YIG superfamily endonuclease
MEECKMINKISGIYIIKNTLNNKVYIGSSVDINNRWNCHKRELCKNKHHNKYLQFAWNKNGKDVFEFKLLEIVLVKEDLIKREQYWMDIYDSYNSEKGYNINPTAGSQLGRKFTEEQRKKSIESSPFKKAIIQLDEKGNIIDKFPSINRASKKNNISRTAIMHALKTKTFFNGYTWVFKEEDFVPKVTSNTPNRNTTLSKKKPSRSKKIARIDSFGNVKVFNSLKEASESLNACASSISRCCKGISLDYKNYIWRYFEDIEKLIDENGIFTNMQENF